MFYEICWTKHMGQIVQKDPRLSTGQRKGKKKIKQRKEIYPFCIELVLPQSIYPHLRDKVKTYVRLILT